MTNGKSAKGERDDPSSAPESGQPAGGREQFAQAEDDEDGANAPGTPPPESSGEDF